MTVSLCDAIYGLNKQRWQTDVAETGIDSSTSRYHCQDLKRWERSMKIYDQDDGSHERQQIARIQIFAAEYLKRNILGWKVDVVIVSRN